MKTRKELKNEYKERKTQMGVFRIQNTLNGKVLIDSSTDIPAKWNRHQWLLKYGHHTNKALQRDWDEYGAGNFMFEVLSEIDPTEGKVTDPQKELDALTELVVEEFKIDPAMRYDL